MHAGQQKRRGDCETDHKLFIIMANIVLTSDYRTTDSGIRQWLSIISECCTTVGADNKNKHNLCLWSVVKRYNDA